MHTRATIWGALGIGLKVKYLIYLRHLSDSSQEMIFLFLYSGREAEKLAYITKYLKAVAMFRDYSNVSQDPDFTQVSLYILLKLLQFLF